MSSAVMDVTDGVAAAPLLTAADRCDRCSAPARVRVLFPLIGDGAELLFCGHHYQAHESALTVSAVIVHDQREHASP